MITADWCNSRFIGVLCFIVQVICFTNTAVVCQEDYPWQIVLGLDTLDDQTFKNVIQPLAQMTENSYQYPQLTAISGWTFLEAAAATEGMHATIYEDDAKTRIVVAFRGTDANSEADLCADTHIFISKPGTVPIPKTDCSQYSSATLDYVSQATTFVTKNMHDYPNASFLLTGHSLGAGLAALAAARLQTTPLLPVVAFSTPGIRQVLKRDNIELAPDQEKRIFSIAEQWDEIMRVTWKDQVGKTCLYTTTQPPSCAICFQCCSFRSRTPYRFLKNPIISIKQYRESEVILAADAPFTPECAECFQVTHGLSHIIDLINVGRKPTCESHLP